MPHTNLSLPDDRYTRERLTRVLLEAEKEFWRKEAERLGDELENIPRAIEAYGYVTFDKGNDVVRLVVRPDVEDTES